LKDIHFSSSYPFNCKKKKKKRQEIFAIFAGCIIANISFRGGVYYNEKEVMEVTDGYFILDLN